ncbi:hypothetical protein FB566_4201 [Stackebrandtia endophytica]|uniref:Uncharacterized protein n=1 Tax=Stackebrandtia endophytica TaxID=1496996 RepID=A0A543B1B0_9ACTN|nr:hypothetical protein [Stackebrandtia endophytica]TQL78611.1 hypothetical protein FB566_4201 [Stackebrandtia endophytica]
MKTIAFVDETTAGGRGDAWHLEIFEEELSLRELIRRRVFQEVAEYNAETPELFTGLVQPGDAEATLNGYRMRKRRKVDPQRQFELAVEAFQRNGFVVLVDDRQIEELDATIHIERASEVIFLKLVPLVGG